MKKLLVLVMAVVIIVMMAVVATGCSTKKTSKTDCMKSGFETGIEDGEIKWSRLHSYGTNSYDQAIEWRQYRKSLGDVVSEIKGDYGRGATTYWFTAGHIAE